MIRRGDCYFVLPNGPMSKGYPAVILSAGELGNLRRINMVQLSLFPRSLSDTDVVVEVTGTPSVARCEVVQSIKPETLGDFVGCCTEEEMQDIGAAVARGLGLKNYG